MNPIERLLKQHSLGYLTRIMNVSNWIWFRWKEKPASISFKNLDKLRTSDLLTAKEYDSLVEDRNVYLKSIKGDRGKHAKKK